MILTRFAESKWGTMGRLEAPEYDLSLYTLEDEWRDNARNVSRIPHGVYGCKRTIYHRYGYETFEVTGVPNRSRILFHPGNTEEDTAGCILLGKTYGPIETVDEETGYPVTKMALYNSRPAFREFMAALEGVDEFDLEIIDDAWSV